MITPTLAAALLLALPATLRQGAPTAELSAPRPGAADVGDPYFPGVGNGGYDVQHYDVSLDVEMEKGAVEAVVKIDAVAIHALSSFNLDFVGLKVEAIDVDGEPAEFRRDGRELIIDPAEPIAMGESFAVTVKYSGIPAPAPDPSVEMLGFEGTGWFKTTSGIYILSECIGAAGWLPCNDHPTDKATFTFRVRVPKVYVVAANGLLIEEKKDGDSKIYLWKASDPMATYLATIDIAPFKVQVKKGPWGIPLRLYYPIGASKKELKVFDRTREMLQFFAKHFGPYPFEAYGGVLSYETIGGALETQTIPVYSRYTGEETVAHEMAHMWFGDCVSPARWQDMWLNEGFAVYAEWMWRAHTDGSEALENEVKSKYRYARRASIGPPPTPGVRWLFAGPTYVRGPLVLHALRQEVGQKKFFEILQGWVKEHFNGTATTEDFVAFCNRMNGESLDPLFATWLYGKVVPPVPEYMSRMERREYEKEKDGGGK